MHFPGKIMNPFNISMYLMIKGYDTHVFQPAIHCCLKYHPLEHTWELTRTCDQLILISPFYITMKSTCFNH